MAKKRNVAVYTRVSTDHEDQLRSFKAQREHYTDYCAKHGYAITKIYADEGISGTNAQRTEFLNMLRDAGLDPIYIDHSRYSFKLSDREPQFDMIIVKDHSRFSRNVVNGIDVATQLHQKGVYILFENAGFSTEEKDWNIRLQISFTIAEQESRSLSERIKWARRFAAERKVYSPSRPPFGYERHKDEETGLNVRIIEEQAEVVREVFQRIVEEGSHTIAKDFNKRGIKTQTGAKWTNDKIARIVKNTAYVGNPTVQRSTRKNITDTKRTINPESSWVVIEGGTEPIVDQETWDLANKHLSNRVQPTLEGQLKGRNTSKNKRYYRKIYCGNCGSVFVRHSKTKQTKTEKQLISSYMCQRRRKFGSSECSNQGISEAVLDRLLRDSRGPNVNAMGVSTVYKRLINHLEDAKTDVEDAAREHDLEIAELEKANENLINVLATVGAGSLSKDLQSLYEKNSQLIQEKLLVKNDITIKNIDDLQSKVIRKAAKIKKFIKEVKKSNYDLIEILEKVVITDDIQVELFFVEPNFEEEVAAINKIFKGTKNELDPAEFKVRRMRNPAWKIGPENNF